MQHSIITGTCIWGCLFFAQPDPPIRLFLWPFYAAEVNMEFEEPEAPALQNLPFDSLMRRANPKHLPRPWQHPERMAHNKPELMSSLLPTSCWRIMAYQEYGWDDHVGVGRQVSHLARVPERPLVTTLKELATLLGVDNERITAGSTAFFPDRHHLLNGTWHFYRPCKGMLVVRWFVAYPYGNQTSFQVDRWWILREEPLSSGSNLHTPALPYVHEEPLLIDE